MASAQDGPQKPFGAFEGATVQNKYMETSGTLIFNHNPGYTHPPPLSFHVAKVGRMVTLQLGEFFGAPDKEFASIFQTYDPSTLPMEYCPVKPLNQRVQVCDAGEWTEGILEVTSTGRVTFYLVKENTFEAQTTDNNIIGSVSMSYIAREYSTNR